MAVSEAVVEWQTSEIIKCLLDDEYDVDCRAGGDLETDGPTGNSEHFDPVLVADKLRRIGDELDSDVTFQAALSDFKKAVALEAAEAAFVHSVEAFCQAQVSESVGVAPELQLIQASVALGLYFMKSAPDLKAKVERGLTAVFNRRVPWVAQQGGWDNVNI